MPPKKQKALDQDDAVATNNISNNNNGNNNAVTGSWIFSASEIDMLRRLIATQEHLEGIPASASSSLLLVAPGTRPSRPGYAADFLPALLQRNVLRHPSADTRAVVCSILSDVLRLGLGVQTPAAAAGISVEQLPWDKKHTAEVAQLFVESLGALSSGGAAAGSSSANNNNNNNNNKQDSQRMRAHALDALSQSHALVPLIRHAKLSATVRGQLFHGLLCNSGAGIDAGYANAAASAICDIITASEEITQAQVETLLSVLNEESNSNTTSKGGAAEAAAAAAAASKTKKKGAVGADAAGAAAGGGVGGSVAATPAAAAASIAAACFRRAEIVESAQPALVQILVHGFDDAARALAAAERAATTDKAKKTTTGDDDNDNSDQDKDDDNDDDAYNAALSDKEKQQQKRVLVDIMAKVGDLAAASPAAVRNVLPQLSALMPATQYADARLLYVKAMTKAFIRNPSLSVDYAQQVIALATRVRDVKAAVKVEAVKSIGPLLMQHVEAGTTMSNNSAAAATGSLWGELPALLAQAVSDSDEAVRRLAVCTAADLVAACPARVPAELLHAVSARCGDKRPAIRALAMEKLACFYQQLRPSSSAGIRSKVDWIPSRIIDLTSLQGVQGGTDQLLVERTIELLLPSPDKIADGIEDVRNNTTNNNNNSAPIPTSLAAAAASGNSKKNTTAAAAASSTTTTAKKQMVQTTLNFGGSDILQFGLAKNVNNNNINGGKNSFTYAEGWVALIEDLIHPRRNSLMAQSTGGNTRLILLESLLNKKRQMRRVSSQLFTLREQAKAMGAAALAGGTAAGVQMKNNITRLSAFLENKFGAGKMHDSLSHMWSHSLLTVKDEKVVRAFHSLDNEEQALDFAALRADLRAAVLANTGSLMGAPETPAKKANLTRFVDENLLVRLAMPFSARHVSELIETARQLRVQIAPGALERLEDETAAELLVQYRAVMTLLKLISVHSPQLLCHAAPELTRWIVDLKSAGGDVDTTPAVQTLIDAFAQQAVQEAASVAASNTKKGKDSNNNKQSFFDAHGKDIKEALGGVCISWPDPGAADAAMHALIAMYPDDQALFRQLLKEIDVRVARLVNQSASSWRTGAVASCFAAFAVLAEKKPDSVAERGDSIYASMANIVIAACRAQNLGGVDEGYQELDQVKASIKLPVLSISGNSNNISSSATTSSSSKSSSKDIQLTSVRSLSAQIVSSAATAVASYVLSLSASRASAAVKDALTLYVNCIRACSEDGQQASIGAALKRFGIHKAILRLVARPPEAAMHDQELLHGEIQAAICISAESNPTIRWLIQQDISKKTIAYGLDCRFLSLLVMTAVSEECKTGYTNTKNLLLSAVENMKQRMLSEARAAAISAGVNPDQQENNNDEEDDGDQNEDAGDDDDADNNNKKNKNKNKKSAATAAAASSSSSSSTDKKATISDFYVSYGDPRALKCYPEYCMPFLVHYMAHHSFYSSEELPENNFNAFQRVWFLLFEVILKTSGVSTVPIIHEMLRKLKSHDDAFNPDNSRTRVMADLGSAVLHQLLSSKKVGQLPMYPGAIILPRTYTKASGKFSSGDIYLPDSVKVGQTPPFRSATMVGAGVTPAKGMRGGSRSAGASPARVGSDADDDDNSNNGGFADAFAVPTTKARGAAAVAATAAADSASSAAVAPKPAAKGKKSVAAPAPKAKAKAAAGTRRGRSGGNKKEDDTSSSSSSSSSSDDDDDEAKDIPSPPNAASRRTATPTKKPAAKGKNAKGKKKAAESDGDDNDDEDAAASPSTPAAAASRSASKQTAAAASSAKKKDNAKRSFFADVFNTTESQTVVGMPEADARVIYDAIAGLDDRASMTLAGVRSMTEGQLTRVYKKAELRDISTSVIEHLEKNNL